MEHGLRYCCGEISSDKGHEKVIYSFDENCIGMFLFIYFLVSFNLNA